MALPEITRPDLKGGAEVNSATVDFADPADAGMSGPGEGGEPGSIHSMPPATHGAGPPPIGATPPPAHQTPPTGGDAFPSPVQPPVQAPGPPPAAPVRAPVQQPPVEQFPPELLNESGLTAEMAMAQGWTPTTLQNAMSVYDRQIIQRGRQAQPNMPPAPFAGPTAPPFQQAPAAPFPQQPFAPQFQGPQQPYMQPPPQPGPYLPPQQQPMSPAAPPMYPSQAPPPPQQPADQANHLRANLQFPGEGEEGWDPDVVAHFNALDNHYAGLAARQDARVRELEGHLSRVATHLLHTENEQYYSAFDNFVNSLAEGFRISGLGQLVESGIENDRLVVFGD